MGLFLASCSGGPETKPGAASLPRQNAATVPAPAQTASPAGDVADGYVETLPPLPKEGYFLKALAPDVYFFSTGHYNTMFIIAERGVILVDPIRGAGSQLKRAITSVTPLPVRFMIYTSAGLDRIGDARMFAEGTQIVAHESAQTLLSRYQDGNRPIPTMAFRQNYTLTYGGKSIELIYPGPGHGAGNTMLYLKKEKVLMLVGTGGPRSLPGTRFESVDLFGQVLGLQEAVKLDFNFWLAGRGPRTGTPLELKMLLQYYYDSRKADEMAMKRVRFQEAAGATNSRDPLYIVQRYHDAVARECFNLLRPAWKPRMMGFEAFALSHCSAWTDFHLTHKQPK